MAVVVVGAGIAGLACARALTEAGVAVRVLERGRVCGGRLATKRYDGRRTDIGAAYFTAQDDGFAALAGRWRDVGLVREWTDTLSVLDPEGAHKTTGPMRWAAPGGLRSLAEDLASGMDVTTGHGVEWIEPGLKVDGVDADAVVLAMPGPQALRILHPDFTGARLAVENQVWLPSLAVTLVFPTRDWSDFHGAFVNDHPVLQTVFDDGERRGDGAPVLVAYTTAEFAEQYVADPSAAADEVEAAVRTVLSLTDHVITSHVHRWTYARPSQAGRSSYYLDEQGIGIAGDAWGSPRVETAWVSGTALGQALVARLS
ncbi:FAD-dependent oxidoreductase [Umezawaea sp. Da 62-37]|uniref:NAD(P)/FAD-dependent oxidoreductase n=1 Tax=Umezawaea sp. Da 62-37 TaxID=3075927 RepID=UPI0028F6EF5F|nr:FAD-dependent oxidoreductase [Umezawaea sp. Da 62-37]WNV83738.1 FAD-dependent oxidoreductase [Umezawaea sp. Da 62-37]